MGVRQASHRRDAITALTLGVALALGPAGSATAAAPALPGTSVVTSASGGPGTLGAVADLATPRLLPDAAADAGLGVLLALGVLGTAAALLPLVRRR
ncbi:hypothetical protein [Cellulomonas sp. B6]|uniref:hypothetical protein n=1 Tax=Cellulomonas sp. B6 TaxID=1295626 RepID=UPI00073C6343|nr:hypothetical protein [Cellulomonas sp. B6]KSW14421.1 hypothetical protein ATM99_02655 [Cellulomonas sp. B6]